MSMNIKLPATAIDVNIPEELGKYMRKTDFALPELEEYDVVRHFKGLLSDETACGDTYICSILSDMAKLDGFTGVHPYQLGDASQGAGELVFTLKHMLSQIFGMADITMQSGANDGSFTALCALKARLKKEKSSKKLIILPDDADEALAEEVKNFGFDVKYMSDGMENRDAAAAIVKFSDVSTENIELWHENGVIIIADVNGAGKLLGKVCIGDIGVDMLYFNAENLFPISSFKGEADLAVVGFDAAFAEYAPVPKVDIDEEEQYYFTYESDDSVGKVNQYYGDFSAMIKVIGCILSLGADGLCQIKK